MSAITAKASRIMKKYAVLTREPRCFLGSFDFSWEQRKLGDIADIVGGGTPSTGNQSYWDGDIDWYAPAEIADQIYANSSQKKITGLGYENSSAKMLPPGTVLFTSRAGIGKTAILTRKGCTNQGFQSIVPHRGELDSYFIFSRTGELKRYGELVGAGSTFVEVSGKQMAVMELMMPPTMREQQTIGGFFQQLDHLITLHQRQCANLCSPSQVVFSLLFATSTFSWEQRKAIDIADYSKGNGYSKGDLTDAGTPIILYGRLYTKYQFAISEVDTFAVPRNGAVYSQGNEVIVPASGETAEDIARASAVEKSGVLLGGDLNILRPFDFINPLFLALAISNGEPQKELAKKAQGKSVVHIHNTDIQEVTIAYPSRTEQDRIVSVFRQLDHLITLHQRECISFTGRADRLILTANKKRTTSSWEQRKAKEICSIGTGKSNTQDQVDDGKYPFYIRSDVPVRSNKYLYDCEAVITIGDGNIGKVFHYVNGKFDLHQRCYKMTDFKDIWGKYFFYYFSTKFYDRAMKMTAKATVDSVRLEMISEMDIKKPPQISEQKQIAEFFANLDNLITLHQRKGKAAVSGCFLNCSSLEKSSAQSRTLELFGQTSNQEIKYIIDGLSILGGKLRNFCVKLIILLSYTRINDIAKYHISRNTECVHNIN